MVAYQGNSLFCRDCSIADLADKLGTPFFLFDARNIQDSLARIRSAFSRLSDGVLIDYCVKTNYELPLLKYFCGLGVGAMVSCGWELELAVEAGFHPEQISFHGPAKTEKELQVALEKGIGLIHVYSEEELSMLRRLASDSGRSVNVSIRLEPPGAWWKRGLVGWYAKRLGFSWDGIVDLVRRNFPSPFVRLTGLSVHLGTQITSASPYVSAVSKLLDLCDQLQSHARIEQLSLGGGWPSESLQRGWMAVQKPSPWSGTSRIQSTLDRVAGAITERFNRAPLTHPPVLRIEPGRGLIGQAGLLVSRVLYTKGRWVFVDASRSFLPESLLVASRLIVPAVRKPFSRTRRYSISGKTLNTMDVLSANVRAQVLEPGDILVFLDAGAYSLSRAARYAGSIPGAWLLTEEGTLLQIRSADCAEEIVEVMREREN